LRDGFDLLAHDLLSWLHSMECARLTVATAPVALSCRASSVTVTLNLVYSKRSVMLSRKVPSLIPVQRCRSKSLLTTQDVEQPTFL
jgi:hypothetical protein